jgi:predicted ATPase
LNQRWRLAKGRAGQVMLLSGEAGIGKSRLVQGLRDCIADESHFRLRYQCTAHHSNSAFRPIIERLQRAARFAPEDTRGVKRGKLDALLAMAGGDISLSAPLFADLLSLGNGEGDATATAAADHCRDDRPGRRLERKAAGVVHPGRCPLG